MNAAEGIIHDTESKMEEFKDQLPADEVRLQFTTVSNLSFQSMFTFIFVFRACMTVQHLEDYVVVCETVKQVSQL